MLSLFDRLKLTPSERRLVVVIMAVVFVVLNYWIIWPRFGDYQALSTEIQELQRKRDTYQREVDRRPTYEVMLRKLQAAGSVLPAGEEKIAFRSDIERLAREIGLTVPRWGEVVAERPAAGTTNAFFESIALPMNQVFGAEDQIVEFLHRVGASNSTVRVKELSLAPGNFDSRAGGKTNLVAVIRLVASVQKAAPKPAPTATGAPVPGAAAGATNRPGATPGMASPRTNGIPVPGRPAVRPEAAPAATPAKR